MRSFLNTDSSKRIEKVIIITFVQRLTSMGTSLFTDQEVLGLIPFLQSDFSLVKNFSMLLWTGCSCNMSLFYPTLSSAEARALC